MKPAKTMRSNSKPLSETHPELARQAWGWDPSQFSAGSPKSVEWKCELGHVTKSRIAYRSKSGQCPVCSGRQVLAGFNDLSTSHPLLANEAFAWDPTTVSAGSGKKRQWKCQLGHIYEAQIANRAKLDSGCPICSGNKVLQGFNDLQTKFPEIAKEADGWDPSQFLWGSGLRKKWRCVEGHCWETTINSRTSNFTGCAVCSGRKVLPGRNDLATTHPEIAQQADGWSPTTVSAGSNAKVSWKCLHGHTWIGTVKSRTNGSGCPVCSNKLTIPGVNDLATTHPEIAAEAEGWDPTTLTFGSDQERDWKCGLGHVWRTAPKSRTKGSGCPICSGQQILKGYNDLATTHPGLAAEADGWDPGSVSRGSGLKLKWRCGKGHQYEAVVSSRTVQRSGCSICSGRQVLAGFNDLATTHPELAAEADGWDPSAVGFGSNKVVRWKGRCGHQWAVRVATRASQGRGCPYCASKKVLPGFNDLATTHPELAAQAEGWDPTTLTFASGKKVRWICESSHIWETTVASRGFSGNKCPICSGQQVLAGFNDLSTTDPDIAAEAFGWDPSTVSRGSGRKLEWECPIGHRWRTTPSARTGSDHTGCPSCSKFGFDPNSDAWVYFVRHPDLDFLQIGITNVPEKRLEDHRRNGFEVVEIRGPMEGVLAKQLERAMLSVLKANNARFVNSLNIRKFSGWSESWTYHSFPVRSLGELLTLVYDQDSVILG
jgi:hypothetical protein